MNRQATPVGSQLPSAPRQPTVVVASTFTADPIGEVIAFWARELANQSRCTLLRTIRSFSSSSIRPAKPRPTLEE